jgi:hypothetical protein
VSVLVLPVDHGNVDDFRFVPTELDGEWTVWDAELQRYVIHEAVWDDQAAHDVAASLVTDPAYVVIWTWSDPVEVV